MKELIKAFKSLSDETRLRTLNVLLEKECCVCEVMQALGISQTRASRSLMILHQAGFLRLRKEGLWSLYSIDKREMKKFYPLLVKAMKQGLAGSIVSDSDRERLKGAKRTGPGCGRGVKKGAD
ncbi:MAG: metalloregulator ArsR/SmtB family transcription factor [Dehalococcoidia bacterium]|nr:metalloregulator ArsR/SmtB family transcription factor [Dehalococcoidia bacterium]